MTKLLSNAVDNQARLRPSPARIKSLTTAVLIFLTTSIILHSFISSHYSGKTPTLDIIGDGSQHSGAVEYQGPGWIRQCKAPMSNPWSVLSEKEIKEVVEVVEKRKTEMNIGSDAAIMFIERLMPNKTDVLPNLLDGDEVEKWARVVLVQQKDWGGKMGGITEWMIGPLPTSPNTEMKELSYIYNSGRNFVKRPIPDIIQVMMWVNDTVNGILKDMMSDLLGETPDFTKLSENPGLMSLSHPTTTINQNGISAWMTLHHSEETFLRDSWSLTPQGMYAHLEVEGFDKSEWHIDGWYYGGTLYNSTDALYTAWKSGKITKTLPNRGGHWTDPEPEVQGIPGRDLSSAFLVQPFGPRVEVDITQNYIRWMGWEFYLSFSQVVSLSLFDIRFRGDRILYELSFQEALAHYAGASPALASQLFLDTLFGFGVNAYELVPGYDCPAYSTYLPIKWYRNGKFFERKNAICVFEAVSDHLLQRHTAGSKVTASKNSYLVVRTVSTVGNYDYTVSIFYLDGSVEVKVHASGYIFTDYLALEDMRKDLATQGETQITEYGYRIHDVVVSSMHTHELLFKADFDILGTNNTLYRVAVEPITRKYPFEDRERNTMHMVHTPIRTEAGLDWVPNAQGIYVVLNNASENTWGEKRGYKIVPGTGMGSPPHLAMINSTALGKAAGWAYRNLWVLRQHDYEPKGTSEWNAWETETPLIDFDKMIDFENVVQEDLVVYFNLGVHHLSNSQDIPNTLMHWAGTSVMFVPHNYFDRDPSRDSAQGVKLSMEKGHDGNIATYYGPKCDRDVTIKKEDIEPDLSGYNPPTGGIAALSMNQTT